GLASGMTVAGDEIPTGASDTLLSVSASAGMAPFLTKIIGNGADGQANLHRIALLPASEVTQRQPWLRSEVAIAILEPAPIQLAWDNADSTFAIGSTYPARFQVKRGQGVVGVVRLALLTSQVVPRTPDGRQEVRSRAVRFEGSPIIAANQTVGEARIAVPGDLPALPYDLAVQAD